MRRAWKRFACEPNVEQQCGKSKWKIQRSSTAGHSVFYILLFADRRWCARAKHQKCATAYAKPNLQQGLAVNRNRLLRCKIQRADWRKWEHRYDGKLKTTDDARIAITTMLASLGDPKTKFRPSPDLDDDSANRHGHYLGLGMNLWIDKSSKIKITNVADGTPAFKAGIHAGDEIMEVDGKSTKGSTIEQIRKQIDGPINTKVVLTVKDGSVLRTLGLSKAALALKSVATVTFLPGNLGYIGVDNLSSVDATEQLRGAVQRLHDCYGLILDLRKNPGGLLNNAVSVADLFLVSDKQCILSCFDRNGYVTSTNAPGRPLTQQTLVLLIDKGTAGGAEILTAALQDNGRATVVGERSCGDSNGLLQGISKFNDGSEIDVSIAHWLTANRTDSAYKGISPDIEVVLNSRERLEGKGPWWLETPKLDPNALMDMQLLRAISFLRDATSTQSTSLEKDPDGKTQSQKQQASPD
jgi:carboxyl-terminal processing protease